MIEPVIEQAKSVNIFAENEVLNQ